MLLFDATADDDALPIWAERTAEDFAIVPQ
jgi:hypothetical protein